MGAYLSEPNLNKESQDSDFGPLSYGASSMQGWRLEQEDAHNSILDFDTERKTSFFAVYDGHGGSEVAVYCAKFLPDYLKTLDEYEKGELSEALKKLFLKFDESLLTAEAQRALKELRDMTSQTGTEKADDDDDEEEDEKAENEAAEEQEVPLKEAAPVTAAADDQDKKPTDEEKEYASETDQLYDEACMPLEEVLKRYSNVEKKVKRVLRGKAVGVSPMISAAGSSSAKRLKNPVVEVVEVTKTTAEFNRQEELDINEIKKNGQVEPEATANTVSHEHDFDEASNLCELTDSQRSVNGSEATAAATAENTTFPATDTTASVPDAATADVTSTDIAEEANVAELESITLNTPTKSNSPSDSHTKSSTKAKLTKEDLKLSPIRKKSMSSSSLIDANESTAVTTTLNGIAEGPTGSESNKENDNNEAAAAANADPAAKSDAEPAKPALNGNKQPESEVAVAKKKPSLSRTDLILKLLAGCVNERIKQTKPLNKKSDATTEKKDITSKVSTKKEGDDEDEDANDNDDDDDSDADFKGEEDDDDDDDDGDEDEDEDSEEYDEDEDEDYEEEDDEEQDDEDAEMDEKYNLDAHGLDSKPGYASGCTAVVALLKENKYLYVANAGDSRCVVCREGKAVDMSVDHKPDDDEERARIEKAGGQVTKDGRVNNGLNLSRAIGDHSYKVNSELPLAEQMITSLPDVKCLEIDPAKDSFMVLACDGIWNFMSSQDVCDYVQERLNANYAKLSQICEELFMHCLAPDSEGDGTGCDNMTCIIVTFNPFIKKEIKISKSAFASPSSIRAESETLKRTLENGEDEKQGNGAAFEPTTVTKKLKQEDESVPTANPASSS